MESYSTKATNLEFPCVIYNAQCDNFDVTKTEYGYRVKNSIEDKSFKTLKEVRNWIDRY